MEVAHIIKKMRKVWWGAGREDGVGQERNGTQNLRVGMAICLEAVKI